MQLVIYQVSLALKKEWDVDLVLVWDAHVKQNMVTNEFAKMVLYLKRRK